MNIVFSSTSFWLYVGLTSLLLRQLSNAQPPPVYTWYTGDFPRLQWTANNGYAGETSLIAAGMRFGQYYSQFDIRAVIAATQQGPNGCTGTFCQQDPAKTKQQQQQLLLGVNDISTATALNIRANWFSATPDGKPGGNKRVRLFITIQL